MAIGSWGLPDFGITEWIAKQMGGGSTGQGGSDIFVNTPQSGQSWSDPTLYSGYNRVSTPTYTPSGTAQQAIQSIPSVLGTKTSSSTGGGSVINPQPSQPSQPSQPGQPSDPYAQLRSEISSGWDNYLNELNQLNPLLETQRGAQEGTAKSQYETGVSNLGTQRDQGVSTAETNQTKTLRDIASNLKNSFMAGNVYLGSRGAGDSSAADQYSYALTKEGSKQRGDVMQETANKIKDIQDTFNTGVNQLKSSYDTLINSIANWFAGKQMEIKQAIANGQLNKSQDMQNLSKDILNQAISAMNTAKSQLNERQSALESWAMSNSQNVNSLMSNLKSVYSVLPQAQAIASAPQVDSTGNINVSTGYGGRSTDEIKRLLGIA